MKRLLLWVGLALTLWATSTCAAQSSGPPLIPIAGSTIGVTWCSNGVARSFVDAALTGSEREEVMAHEKVHRNQVAKRVGFTGICPGNLDPEQQLTDEVEAYCAGRDIRRTHVALADVDDQYLRILLTSFWQELPVAVIIDAYRYRCVNKRS